MAEEGNPLEMRIVELENRLKVIQTLLGVPDNMTFAQMERTDPSAFGACSSSSSWHPLCSRPPWGTPTPGGPEKSSQFGSLGQ
jgi:hypothetical protein